MQSHEIQDYRFGSMTVDGTMYTKDLILLPDRILTPWWRKEGHLLQIEDLKEVIAVQPDLLVIGTGAYGVMKLSDRINTHFKDAGIELRAAPTTEAWKLYNKFHNNPRLAGAFHLTC